MMRTIVAILALSPALLHGQSNASAQPSSTPVLQSSLVQPVSLAAVKAADDATANSTSVRVSTYTPPKRIRTAAIEAEAAMFRQNQFQDCTVVVDMTVDASGKPEDLKVEKSGGELTDKVVLAAVSQYRYAPATLNGQPVATPVKIEYNISQGSR